ncbi:hypothetical protein TNCV_4103601 [Trichonephila clavipes]|nr:hypothetical protein TNCV_4103601 [Trichonephila clavipes]
MDSSSGAERKVRREDLKWHAVFRAWVMLYQWSSNCVPRNPGVPQGIPRGSMSHIEKSRRNKYECKMHGSRHPYRSSRAVMIANSCPMLYLLSPGTNEDHDHGLLMHVKYIEAESPHVGVT